ncbi:MAG: methyltransferase [Hyphomicrobium sp.]|uniref:methyltransferase n=1 Tax=Hyphomicrobium sp. TaxID=82 RepID=UPI00132AD771|nr:methyltransferase [Hyphomicrobium sp.]KAB2939655.1 MAG: methyltransferase [Hyphomicrobium sp.]MBZ0208069.1 methyltransferase [Hyphomicrobium sp.]
MSATVTPNDILQLGMGFWGSKTLLSAVELGVFGELAKAPANIETLTRRLGLHPRSARDFLDALVALRMLERVDGIYRNTSATDLFLDPQKPSYVGGVLEMANARLYGFWGSLTEALRTGAPQNESKGAGSDLFEALYADPERLKRFLRAMSSISAGPAQAIAAKFPWADYSSFVDVGCAQGMVPVTLAHAHAHLTGYGFDLPEVGPVFRGFVENSGLSDRISFVAGNFFEDPLPTADVIVMGHILHDWDLEQKRALIAKAYEALPMGGAFIAYDAIIDDERRQNAYGLLMSLNMLIETTGGFDYTGADCQAWMRAAGFSATRVEPLVGSTSMVIGRK